VRDEDGRIVAVGDDPGHDLVRAIATGSPDALAALFDRFGGLVLGLASRITGRQEDAEEVVQDVFTQVWRRAAQYDAGRATVAGWLTMMTRTRALDRLRARRARPDVDGAVPPDAAPPLSSTSPDPEQVAIADRAARQVRGALSALPDAQRTLVDMAYYEGLTHSEIAARTGLPLGTVKTRLRTAAAALRSALAG
jgi:RNA polymerase sigma-70 factor (ECF subfamily)